MLPTADTSGFDIVVHDMADTGNDGAPQIGTMHKIGDALEGAQAVWESWR